MKTARVALAFVVLTACGQVANHPATSPVARATSTATATSLASPSPTPPAAAKPTPRPSAVPTPKVSPTLLFAVLEAKGTANSWTYNTVAIAGLDGYAKAKTTFTPMPVPDVGCMGAIIPPSAHVAAGKVYFADGHGVVRSLGIDGKVTTVATFPMTSTQQMLSFAVSPDGTQIVGAIFSAPKTAFSCTSAGSGSFSYDAYRVISPTTNALVYHQSWTSPPANVMALTGWDALGPFGTYPTVWASQGGGPGSTLGVFVRIDSSTLKPGAVFSDPSKCEVWNSVASGASVCTSDPTMTNGGTAKQSVTQPVSIRRANGTEEWHFTVVATNGPFGPFLAPNEQAVAICCDDTVLTSSGELVATKGGARYKLGAGFSMEGWLDSATLVGSYNTNPLAQPPFTLAYVALNSPAKVVPLGFAGQVVGTVRG